MGKKQPISKKSYYAIIPANVRYDKKLPELAKLLYGELTALSNEKGYCWAGNDYFADLYDKKPRTISRNIKALKDAEYIKIVINNMNQRKIFINNAK